MDDIERVDDRPWSPEEVATIASAVNRAPSVYNTQPWSLLMRDRVVELYERDSPAELRHDTEGRDRLISCGAALMNLVLAVRKLGWRAELPSGHDFRLTGLRHGQQSVLAHRDRAPPVRGDRAPH
ncbi:hypothetical protein [Saccharopolyspora sp. NPDC049426]|uniref:nitroreductase family protein n=1 Tax=Saccharopolyspora sp. NPDC049426 TaxID=3155652 RepID=UPI0034215E95